MYQADQGSPYSDLCKQEYWITGSKIHSKSIYVVIMVMVVSIS